MEYDPLQWKDLDGNSIISSIFWHCKFNWIKLFKNLNWVLSWKIRIIQYKMIVAQSHVSLDEIRNNRKQYLIERIWNGWYFECETQLNRRKQTFLNKFYMKPKNERKICVCVLFMCKYTMVIYDLDASYLIIIQCVWMDLMMCDNEF